MKILIVDDKTENLYMLEALLKASYYKVVSAKNGAEALGLAYENPPDLIISDILMPLMDGFTLCRKVKTDEKLKHIPFIFYTATYMDPKDEEYALKLGADRFILKPQEPDIFLDIIQGLLDEVKSQKISLNEPIDVPETIILKEYNEVLIRKLEDKMQQTLENEEKLTRYVKQLEEEIKERQSVESEIKKLNQDLEERVGKRTNQLQVINKELEAFTYSVSHDLRAPLRAISGFSSQLLECYNSSLDDEGKDLLKSIINNVKKMNQLIDDLLEFSRLGRKDIRKNKIDMTLLCSQIFDELISYIPDKKVKLNLLELPPAFGDFSLLKQVVTNLLSNAIKFSSKNENIEITVSGKIKENEVVFSISDNGVGFDPRYSNKLFNVFQRLHGQDEFEGTGVGLAIVQRIIDKHEGRVWAEAELNKGATFYFSLPLTKEE